MNYLSNYFTDKNILNLLQTIKPTNWQTLKTEAIDFESDFYWIEDFPFQAEMKILEQYNKLENLICVDLKNPNELLNVVEALNSK
jgi:hypothetical protein